MEEEFKRKRCWISQKELNNVRHQESVANSQIKRAGKKGTVFPTIYVCGCNAPGGCLGVYHKGSEE